MYMCMCIFFYTAVLIKKQSTCYKISVLIGRIEATQVSHIIFLKLQTSYELTGIINW